MPHPLLSLLASLAPLLAPADETKPRAIDLAAMSGASAPRISPDGSKVAYVLTTRAFDESAKPSEKDTDGGWKTERQLWIAPVAPAMNGEPRQLTFGSEAPGTPAWSHDGTRIAFAGKAEGKRRIHVLPIGGGEAQPVDTGDLEPGAFEWSPDDRSFAFTASPPRTEEEKAEAWRSGGAHEFEEQWRPAHLYVVPAEGGKPRRLTPGDEHVAGFHWSPDGERFVLVTSRSSDLYEEMVHPTPAVVRASDGSVVKTLGGKDPRILGRFEWSPDGRFVAFEAADGGLSLLNGLFVHEVDGERSWNVAPSRDLTLDGFVWSADSRSIVAHVLDRTKSRLLRLPVGEGSVEDWGVLDRVVSSGLDPDRARRAVAFLSSTTAEPYDPTVLDLGTRKMAVVARTNPQVAEWSLAKTELVRWKNAEGVEIEGVLFVTPQGGAGPPPLMVLPHGGPDAVTSESFSSWAHFFAARGFSVFRPNYRGGFGYGFDFYAANRGRLGEIEEMDIESGVDHLVATKKADPARLVYGGWSWGGYLAAWTIGRTERYRAAVVGAGVVDTVMQYALSDINHGVTAAWEFLGDPYRQFDAFDRANPLRGLARARTPTLVIHGTNDDRVPFPHGVTLYRALRDVGCETRFLVYPREPHGFQEPAHVRHMLEAWVEWYATHCPGVDR